MGPSTSPVCAHHSEVGIGPFEGALLKRGVDVDDED